MRRFTVEQAYSLVMDVEKYHEFVPFCNSCRLAADALPTEEEERWLASNPDGLLQFAVASIGFKAFSESYRSRIKCIPNLRIEAYSDDARLFDTMLAVWEFIPVEGQPGHCEIRFTSDFEFKSALYSTVAGYFLDHVADRNLEAFTQRLHAVYGNKKSIQ